VITAWPLITEGPEGSITADVVLPMSAAVVKPMAPDPSTLNKAVPATPVLVMPSMAVPALDTDTGAEKASAVPSAFSMSLVMREAS
tara:strand:- start:4074 stop:4331 length:258 start_codon:yes stop_codon:yes gene_type:complete